MKITNEKIEISESESIPWREIETLKILNDKLSVFLSNGRVIELSHLHPSTIDMAFRTYEKYLNDHPHKSKQK